MHQVAPGRHEFFVVAANEFFPRKVGVARLRHVGSKHVAERVGVVTLEEFRHPDCPVSAGGDLCVFEG